MRRAGYDFGRRGHPRMEVEMELLINVLPLLLLALLATGGWALFKAIRRQQRIRTRSLELLERQQVLLERIAAALERREKNTTS